jgi:hypothetical protein
VHRLLGLRVTIDQNVCLPERIPRGAMLPRQLIEAGVARLAGEPQVIRRAATPALA